MKKSGFVTLKVFVYISNLLLRRYYHLASLLPQRRNPDASRLSGPHDPRGVVRHRSWVATTPTRSGGRTSRTGEPRARVPTLEREKRSPRRRAPRTRSSGRWNRSSKPGRVQPPLAALETASRARSCPAPASALAPPLLFGLARTRAWLRPRT